MKKLMFLLLLTAFFAALSCSCKKKQDPPPQIQDGPIEGYWKWVAIQEEGDLSPIAVDTLAGIRVTIADSLIYDCKFADSSFVGMKWRMQDKLTIWGPGSQHAGEFTGALCITDEKTIFYFDRYTDAELDIVRAWGCFP